MRKRFDSNHFLADKDIKANLLRETLVDRIVSVLEGRILKGELPPKKRVSETRVAKEFQVSRVPAREALQRLQEMNLIRRTHLGREVMEFSLGEFREIYELKNLVEAFGVLKGARRATEPERRRIRSILDSMQSAFQTNDLKRMRDLNLKFHDSLVHCSRSQMVIQLHDSLAKRVRWAASRSFQFQNRPELSVNEHLAIFKAFESGEGEKARALMETHTNESMERSLSKFTTEERPSENLSRGREKGKKKGTQYSATAAPSSKPRRGRNSKGIIK